jgi:N-acyl-D-amino-acid deacylase
MTVVEPGAPELDDHRGETLAAIARRDDRDPLSAYFDLAVASGGNAQLLNDGYGGTTRDESLIEKLIRRPDALIGTDTVPLPAAGGGVHVSQAMSWGTMPRFIGRWCRDRALVPLEQAIRRLTAVPADVVGLRHRGRLAPGAFADVVVFDLERISDGGTPSMPEPPAGVHQVFVNGVETVRDGNYDPAPHAGRTLRIGR